MAHARPFSTSTFQDLFDDIQNTSRWGVLTPAIELWSFGSLGGLLSPHFGSVNFILTLFSKWGCDKKFGIIELNLIGAMWPRFTLNFSTYDAFRTPWGTQMWVPNRNHDAPPSSLCDPKKVQRVGFVEMVRNLMPLLASSTKGGRGVVLEVPGLD
jgi:hypothetical protein